MLHAANIDWNTTGTWFGGFMTALGVFLAARLSTHSSDREFRRRHIAQLGSLKAIFSEGRELVIRLAAWSAVHSNRIPTLDYSNDYESRVHTWALFENSDMAFIAFSGTRRGIPEELEFSEILDAVSSISPVTFEDRDIIKSIFIFRRSIRDVLNLAGDLHKESDFDRTDRICRRSFDQISAAIEPIDSFIEYLQAGWLVRAFWRIRAQFA